MYIYIYTRHYVYSIRIIRDTHSRVFILLPSFWPVDEQRHAKNSVLKKTKFGPLPIIPHMSPISNFPIFLPRSPWLSVVLVVFLVARGVHRHGLHDRTPRGCYGVATQLSPSDDGGVSWPMVEVMGHHHMSYGQYSWLITINRC